MLFLEMLRLTCLFISSKEVWGYLIRKTGSSFTRSILSRLKLSEVISVPTVNLLRGLYHSPLEVDIGTFRCRI